MSIVVGPPEGTAGPLIPADSDNVSPVVVVGVDTPVDSHSLNGWFEAIEKEILFICHAIL